MDLFKKIWFPVLLIIASLIVIFNGLMTEQNGAFLFGALALLIAGAVSLVSAMVQLNPNIRLIVSVALGLLIVVLGYANYQSIKVPIEFQNEKDRRYAHVIQRLKDIRTAELAFKAKYQKYTGSLDTLVDFIKNDSLTVIKAFGEVPDTMSLQDAIAQNIVRRDTTMVPVQDSLFGPRQAEGRVHKFVVDSLPVVPFTGGKRFDLKASKVERAGAKVPVFKAEDSAPYDRNDAMAVGSLSDPKTNGNWE